MANYNAIRYNHDFAGNAGNLTLLSTFTSDGSDATASFTSGIDSTYEEYLFVFNNIHCETNDKVFQFNVSVDGGSNYNVAKTTSFFEAYHNEGDSATALTYNTGTDLAQGTGFQTLLNGLGNGNDESVSGILKLFNPSSTTFVKHFIATLQGYNHGDYSLNEFVAGYANTTSAINAVQFKMNSGEIQGGTIQLFGVS
tara:strand:+ start:620 stop:1210 length:591 start_codon:yes stop_codon:yes gene_type:complete